jgi:hypothetical protein
MTAQDHGAQLAQHEAEIAELRKGLASLADTVNTGFKEVAAGFTKLTSSMHELRASAGPSLRDILSTVTTGAVLFGAVVSGIIYLARGGNTEKLHELELRIQRMETVLSLKRTSGAAWVPDRAGW